uniref:ANK_REP_REGION domain-containing protein n=1 Tax=Anopheles minimus TaxID=112268 RepID=A0A182WB42_9DIPT
MSDSEENHGDSLCIVQMFEAIRDKDEQTLARVLQQSTIETILMFNSMYGFTPLAYCLQKGDVSHLGLVRCLLTSGLCDSEVLDRNGQTVLANLAQAHNDNSNYLERIIEIVIDGVDDATACYRMLKHNSLALFKTFLAVKQYDESRLFESLANAITKLNIKQFDLSINLRVFVQWKLADYAYRHLSGDYWKASRESNSNEWKDHVDVISTCWDHIAEKYDTATYENVDDRLLHRLHTIHNHLYFLQHKQFFRYLPLQEAVFCLAVFINIFKQPHKFYVYRFMVHKCLVVEFVRMIAFQLTLAKKCLESVEVELKSIMTEAESCMIPMKIDLIEEMKQRIEASAAGHRQPAGRMQSLNSSNSSEDTSIRSLMQRMKKVDKNWTGVKIKEIREKHREYLIELLETRLEHVVHPQNVADRILARTKRNPSTGHSEIAADIVASALFDLEHLMRGKDRRTRRKLIKCYNQMKQYHSLSKIVTTFALVAYGNRANVETFRDCLKRVVTVLGETMKSTKSTPNMSNDRLKEAMEQMLTWRFAETNILHRNNYAREFSLARLLVDGEMEQRVYSVLPKHTAAINMVINLLFVILLADIRRSFYGVLVRCGTLSQLRALLIMAGENDAVFRMQQAAFQEVQKYFTNVKALFAELRKKPVAKTVQFLNVEKQFIFQCTIVEELEAMLAVEAEYNYESIRKTCFSCNCSATIRRILHWKLDSYHPNRLLQTICEKWDPNVENLSHIELMDLRLTWIDPTTVSSNLSILLNGTDSAAESHQLSRTRELIQTVQVVVEDEDAILQLNNMLRPYYENIFFLDNKWKVLESFCRQRQLPLDSTLVRKLRQYDQEHLQTLFDGRRGKLRSILEQNNIRMVDELYVGVFILEEDIRASLEHLQLELCEMLTAVGYFGDSFHYMKHRIPMIQGRNYRNLLAHDALSYNLLTDSGDSKLIINAYIFANTNIRLFHSRRNEPVDLRFSSLEDTVGWLEEQQQLLAAIKSNDLYQVHEKMRAGGEIKSYFLLLSNVDQYLASYLPIPFHVQGLCDLDPSIVALLGLHFPNLPELYNDPKIQLESAVVRRDYEVAFKFVTESELRKEFYAWPNLVSRLSSKLIATKTTLEKENMLKYFLDYGNEKCIEEMFRLYGDCIIIESVPDIVCKALFRGLRTTVEHFVRIACRLPLKSLELAIVMHWNDMLCNIAAKTDLDERAYITLSQTSIKANNDAALVYFLNDQQFTSDVLKDCYLTASSIGRYSVLKYLLTTFPPTDHSVLSAAIHKATLYGYWQCVQLLLDADAPVDVLFPGYEGTESNVLLHLIMFEQFKLILKINYVNRAIYGTLADHPFAVALRYNSASSRILRALRSLGFSWLDCSTTLHEAILQGYDQPAWNIMWREIDDHLAQRFVHCTDQCTLHLNVLQRWKMIAFVEECNMDRTALGCATETHDTRILQTLLDRMCSMRRFDDIGVLEDIVFLVDSSIIRHCKAEITVNGNVTSCCGDMINRINALHYTTNDLQECTINVGEVSIRFAVPAHVQVSEDAADLRFIDSSSLIERLHGLHNLSNSLFTTQTLVHATFSQDDRTTYFLRIENISCLYDILPPGSRIDVTNILNAPAAEGETVLMMAIKNVCNLDIVQPLVELGANPLLADNHGKTPIGLAMEYKTPEVSLYLMDECLRRDLRNADGISVLDVTDGTGGNKLIHIAVMNGHEEMLGRLLELKVDTTSQNVYGYTPAHIVANIPFTNTISMMKQLLDYDRTVLNMLDSNGGTLLRSSAQANSITILDLLMEYDPNLTLQSNRDALYEAIMQYHVQWAKRFLHHAMKKGVMNVTSMENEGDDAVIMSLTCVDFELSRALLEYELGHRMEDVTARDRPRIEAILQASTSKIPKVPVGLLLELRGLNESHNFLTFLQNLLKERMPENL